MLKKSNREKDRHIQRYGQAHSYRPKIADLPIISNCDPSRIDGHVFLLGVIWFKLTNVKNAVTVVFTPWSHVWTYWPDDCWWTHDCKGRGKKKKMESLTASLGTVCQKDLRPKRASGLTGLPLPKKASMRRPSGGGLTDRHALPFIRAEGLTERTDSAGCLTVGEDTDATWRLTIS